MAPNSSRFSVAMAQEEERRVELPGASVGQLMGWSPVSARTRWRVGAVVAAATALALAVGLFGVRGLRQRVHGKIIPPKIKSIAVLPLVNLTGDASQEYFVDGMTDALITDLGKISALRVISRTSVMRYKGTKKPAQEIAQELDVDAILEGTVIRAGDRVRVSANLIQASPERHLWAESYERDLRDGLALQGDVARAVAREIEKVESQR